MVQTKTWNRPSSRRAKLEVRGGTLRVIRGKGSKAELEIGPETIVVGRNEACDLVLDDRKVSAVHMELVATERGVRVRDLGSRNGTFLGDTRVGEIYLLKPTQLLLGDTGARVRARRPRSRSRSPTPPSSGRWSARAPAMRAVFERLRKTAPTELSVLITGETGTGKELVAQAMHEASPRAQQAVRRGRLRRHPRDPRRERALRSRARRVHRRRRQRISPFVEADGGTIFLDELGELPLDVQPKLLRALAEQRIKSVGVERRTSQVNVRVIAATRRDLVREVNAGTFRSDLYFRVAQLARRAPGAAPAPRGHPGPRPPHDGRPRRRGRVRRASTNDSLERLMRHDWPGNVRELRNVVAVALAFGKEGPLDLAQHLAPMAQAGESTPTRGRTFQDAKRDMLARFEREYFTALYAECAGNVSEIGRRAAMERAHVRGYLRRHGIGERRSQGEGALGNGGAGIPTPLRTRWVRRRRSGSSAASTALSRSSRCLKLSGT